MCPPSRLRLRIRPRQLRCLWTLPSPVTDGHTDTYELAYADPTAREHSYTRPDSYASTYKFGNAGTSSDQHPNTQAYGHTDSHKYTVADTGSNRHECPSGNIHTPNNRVIVADTLPLPHAGTDKLAYVYADPDTIAHGCAD